MIGQEEIILEDVFVRMTGRTLAIEFVIVTLFGIIMPVLGYWLYRKAEDRARRKGTLSAY